jgi:hypothetical protein
MFAWFGLGFVLHVGMHGSISYFDTGGSSASYWMWACTVRFPFSIPGDSFSSAVDDSSGVFLLVQKKIEISCWNQRARTWTNRSGQEERAKKDAGGGRQNKKKMKNFATNFQIWQTKTLSSAFEIGFEREL